MKKILIILITITLSLTGCNFGTSNADSHAPKPLFTESLPEKTLPMNYDYITAVWLAYTDYPQLLSGDFAENIRNFFQNAKAEGINTVFAHVSAHNDAFYDSKLFPKAYDGDFDMLEIMLTEARKSGLSLHAWINPLRTKDSWLDPTQADTIASVKAKVHEIISNYDVDGIHIDDYFYPKIEDDPHTAEEKIASINNLVKSIRDTVKTYNKNLIFSISPAGNMGNNLTKNFADVQYWFDNDYADVIIPQLYYGFENQYLPFEQALSQWLDMASESNVRLAIGLAKYKVGKEDINAGTGANEWIENPDIIERQIEIIKNNEELSGYAYFG